MALSWQWGRGGWPPGRHLETRPLGGFVTLLACHSPSGTGSARVTGAAITALGVRVGKLRREIYLAVSSLAHVRTKICIRVS